MKRILMIAAMALIAVSCNKNQKAVKTLDGTWNATSVVGISGGVTVDLFALGVFTSFTYTFDGCKLKDDEFCGITITIVADGDTDTNTGLYTVIDDGLTLQMKDDLASTELISMEIVELTKSELKLRQVEGAGTADEVIIDFVFEKQ
ncbi:MAG: hypothetical protein GQ574_15480 [Crocinitomix sp.]|nr:hypothetical protein [Crocinitomix sp.]